MDNTKAKTVEKALAIIEYLLKNEEEKRITDIAKDLKINTSTIQRIVNTLHGENYLYQDPSSRKYKLGLKFLEISKNILKQIDLRRITAPYLRELRDQTGETVHLMVLDDSVGVYIDALESLQRTRVVSSIGTRDDLYYSAVGKAILAYLSDSEVERIAKIRGLRKITHKTITNLNLLKQELKKIRNRGYSIDDEEGEVGTRCIGAPIFNHNGKVISSISIAAPCHRLSLKKINDYIPLMIKTANKISNELGNNK
ncbi:MAG: IclR family transcriptional regulator [Candidatus Marinimicrobia bacterium]|nr:IclR family transcriptional regulator [Candidatus Neomarinimicrobiota bacterium]